ncbi:MAG: DUF362 domain-containing protein [Desulfobacteraceae bacterium]|nr:DUF362 domain-containing protein [Desulfobacteraceae bacterium]
MAKVVLIRCESYDRDEVKKAVERGLALLGGISSLVREGEKILLKPNLLAGEAPSKCVTTHPMVFEAVAESLIRAGANVSYGDSPALGTTSKAAQKAGVAETAERLNVPSADFKSGVDIFFDKGIQSRKFTIAKAVLDADGVVSLPKLKTHGLEKFTGAVKNQFGCIPGVLKGEFHVRLPDAEAFAKMLVDLNAFVNPRLYVMDAVYGMEGNGPRGGRPRKMNLLLFSTDPVALDATACRLVDLNPEYVPTVKYGMEAGAGTFLEPAIELLGDDFNGFVVKDFDIDRKPLKPWKPNGFTGYLNNRLVPRPYIVTEKCVKCGICVNICPAKPKALLFKEDDKSNPPVYDYDHCIRCFCCQEICPESAIQLKTPLLRKILNSF